MTWIRNRFVPPKVSHHRHRTHPAHHILTLLTFVFSPAKMGIDVDLWRARIGLFNASRAPRLHSMVNLVNVRVGISLLTALCGAVLTVFIPYFLLTHILCTSQLPRVASIHAVYTLHPLYVLSSFASLIPVLRLMSCLFVTVGVITVSHSFGCTISISISGYKISQKLIIILLLSYCLAHLLILAGDVETNPGPERGKLLQINFS